MSESDLCPKCPSGVLAPAGSDASTGIEWIKLECGRCGHAVERRGERRLDPSRDESGDLIGAWAYYRRLFHNWLLTSAGAELTIIPMIVVSVMFGEKFAEYAWDAAFFGLILYGADRAARRYGLTAEELGWSDADWPLYAAIGVITTLAMISVWDVVFFMLGIGSHWDATVAAGGRVRIFTGVAEFIRDLGKIDLSQFALLYLKYTLGAFAEEVYCRGVLFGVINRRDGSAWGMFWSSLVFSAWHQPLLQGLMFGWELGMTQLVVRTISGALYCWLRMRTGSLVAPFFAHCTHNMFVSVRLLAKGAETL